MLKLGCKQAAAEQVPPEKKPSWCGKWELVPPPPPTKKSWTIILAMRQRPHAVPSAAMMGALVSRRVSRVCSSSIATPIAKGIIGRSIKKTANDELPS